MINNFESLGLSAPILKAVKEEGYKTPSPIQAKAIVPVTEGRDVLAAAQTGTGKTAAFTLPILERISNRPPARSNQATVLILTPTRELAAQIGDSINTYGRHLKLKSLVVFGGVKINPQMMKLRKGVDILVATPGRLLDLYSQNAVRFNQLGIVVLDEADRMLDMGFIHDIKKILAILPKKRQTLMFSATFSDEVRALAKSFVTDPVEIAVAPKVKTADGVEQWIHAVDKSRKSTILAQIIKENRWNQVLVFCRTKHGANRLTKFLDCKGIKALAIHGNKSQAARTKALAAFKKNSIQALVATDIAARGIDIDQLPHVVNFDLPHVPEDYVHRIGRTGRAGETGQALSLVCADEFKQLSDIERLIKKLIERRTIDGYEPVNKLPDSKLNTKPFKPKKPKKNKNRQNHGHDGRTHQPTSNSKKKKKKYYSKKH